MGSTCFRNLCSRIRILCGNQHPAARTLIRDVECVYLIPINPYLYGSAVGRSVNALVVQVVRPELFAGIRPARTAEGCVDFRIFGVVWVNLFHLTVSGHAFQKVWIRCFRFFRCLHRSRLEVVAVVRILIVVVVTIEFKADGKLFFRPDDRDLLCILEIIDEFSVQFLDVRRIDNLVSDELVVLGFGTNLEDIVPGIIHLPYSVARCNIEGESHIEFSVASIGVLDF